MFKNKIKINATFDINTLMILFLDVVSPIPEFYLINDKKIIVSIKLLKNNEEKLSDTIIPMYLEINNTYKLNKNITHLIITTGPGSYTSLRVGASFIAGLSQSLSLPVSVISGENIYQFLSSGNKRTCVYFESSKNQKFITYKREKEFFHQKIENENFILPKQLTNLFYNFQYPKFINTEMNFIPFSIINTILKNLNYLEFKKNFLITPIYISNNIILN